MIIYSLPEQKHVAGKIYKELLPCRNVSRGRCDFRRFLNGEWHLRLHEDVSGKDCAIIGSFAPPAEQMIKTLILAHTLKKEGARKVVALFPYLAYTRHDRDEEHLSFITDWIGRVSAVSGIDKVMTIDIHSKTAASLMRAAVIDISPVRLFLEKMAKSNLADAMVIAPDEGARERAEDFRKAAGITRPVVYFRKIRRQGKVVHTEIVGKISGNAILVDDVLDTGNTLLSCVNRLAGLGVSKITIAVTHGMFTGDGWKKMLRTKEVKKIITTDSFPEALKQKEKKIRVVSCAPLLAEAIRKLLA